MKVFILIALSITFGCVENISAQPQAGTQPCKPCTVAVDPIPCQNGQAQLNYTLQGCPNGYFCPKCIEMVIPVCPADCPNGVVVYYASNTCKRCACQVCPAATSR